ncbi:PQQ-binding-like beta-propeller repeat protein, partial [Endozoicomonas acroporae]
MWKHQFQSDKPVSVIRYPKVHNGDIHYIDDSRNLMVLDGFTFNLKYQSDIEEKAHIQQIVDGQLFLIAKKERGEMIYRFDNGMLSAQFDSEMEDCWVLPDNRLFCSTDVALSTGPKSSSIIRYFDLETGQSLWEFDPSLVLGYKEKSEEGVFYGGKENNKLYRLNPDTGETLWHIDLPEGVKTANEPIRVYDSVLSVSLEKKIKQRGRRDRRLRFMWGLNP